MFINTYLFITTDAEHFSESMLHAMMLCYRILDSRKTISHWNNLKTVLSDKSKS